jgi:hypothetical protein
VIKSLYLLAFALTLLSAEARAQDATQAATLTARFTQLLRSIGNGRSPSPEDIIAAAGEPQPTREDLHQALPLILKALDSTDRDVRAYTLTSLSGLEIVTPAPTALGASAVGTSSSKRSATAATAQPTPFEQDVACELTPAIPQIAAHLSDETESNRILTANVLAGFAPHPPATVYPPLVAYLQRDDAVGPVGQAVVETILSLGPIPVGAAEAVSRFLRRADQTPDARANLIDAITTHPNQSQTINLALLTFLDSDDPAVRSRLILSLPQLDLAPDLFADTRARIAQIAANDQDNLQVVTAAKSVTACWTAPRMTTPCPAY